MAFVFRAEKKPDSYFQEHHKINVLNNYKNKITKEIEDSDSKIIKANNIANQSSIPFLSSTHKLIKKIEDTPGPGQYNINKDRESLAHRQYLKNNLEKYKSSLNNHYSYFTFNDLKNDKKLLPGPGQYNPGENELFGAKIKNILKRNNSFSSLIDRFPKIIINVNKINETKKENFDLSIKYLKNNRSNINNQNKNSSFSDDANSNISLTSKSQHFTKKDLFKNLLNNHKLRRRGNQKSTQNLNETSFIYQVSNDMNKDSNRSNLTSKDLNFNSSRRLMPIKTYQNLYKNLNPSKNKSEINTEIRETIYYLNEFINSKYFSQNPGPGYYFSKNVENCSKSSKSNCSTKVKTLKNNNSSYTNILYNTNNSKIILKNQNLNNSKNCDLSITNNLFGESSNKKNKSNQTFKKTKTVYELQSDFRKKIFEKEKQIYLKNKQSNFINSLILEDVMKEKDKNDELNILKKNNSERCINLNTKEARFKGPSGYQNEVYKNDNPGPGEYDVFDNNCIAKKNANIVYNQFKKLIIFPDEKKDRKLFLDDIKNTNPPVGYYQSQIHGTIDYSNKVKNMKWVDKTLKNGIFEKIKNITENRVKNMKIKEEKTKSLLGPFTYFKNIEKTKSTNATNVGFGKFLEKTNPVKKGSRIGPGDYNIDLNTKWVKKTYNVLFV